MSPVSIEETLDETNGSLESYIFSLLFSLPRMERVSIAFKPMPRLQATCHEYNEPLRIQEPMAQKGTEMNVCQTSP
jgi:hypothetical protein